MTLEEFVKRINEQEEIKVDSKLDKEANTLANVFLNNINAKDEELERIINDKASTDNDIACAKIIINAKKNNGKYKYLQGNNLFAKVDIFKPYLDKDCLNQKWHVLISLLAFLDVSSFDEDCENDERFNNYRIGKIKEIELRNEKLKISHEEKVNNRTVKSYSSPGMIGFIKGAIDKNICDC